MGDMGDTFKIMRDVSKARTNTRDSFYSKIIEELGGKFINNSTYRLGEYNIYTSKGIVMHKSNTGERIPLQIFLKENYNYEIDGKELNKQLIEASKNA